MAYVKPLPLKVCDACEYMIDAPHDGGYCYMFREEPPGNYCAQFRATSDHTEQKEHTDA